MFCLLWGSRLNFRSIEYSSIIPEVPEKFRLSILIMNSRKQDSIDDQKYVEKVTRKLGLTFYSKKMKSTSATSEGEMRQERMSFYDDIMKKTQARVLIQRTTLMMSPKLFCGEYQEVLGWKDYAVPDQSKNTKTII